MDVNDEMHINYSCYAVDCDNISAIFLGMKNTREGRYAMTSKLPQSSEFEADWRL